LHKYHPERSEDEATNDKPSPAQQIKDDSEDLKEEEKKGMIIRKK
jgi:hypothetical protein